MVKYRESEEMYLETILMLKQKGVTVHSIRIAEELDYSRASVSRGVNLLLRNNYITVSDSGEINFTDKGKRRAEDIYERHMVITELLQKIGADKELAEENACRIEHVISPELFEILKKFNEKR